MLFRSHGEIVPGFVTGASGFLVMTSSSSGAVYGEVVPGFLTNVDGHLIVTESPGTPAWRDGLNRFWKTASASARSAPRSAR